METTLSNPRAVRGEIAFFEKGQTIFGVSEAHPFMTKERENKAVCLNALSFFIAMLSLLLRGYPYEDA